MGVTVLAAFSCAGQHHLHQPVWSETTPTYSDTSLSIRVVGGAVTITDPLDRMDSAGSERGPGIPGCQRLDDYHPREMKQAGPKIPPTHLYIEAPIDGVYRLAVDAVDDFLAVEIAGRLGLKKCFPVDRSHAVAGRRYTWAIHWMAKDSAATCPVILGQRSEH